jgi:hypothetical protein
MIKQLATAFVVAAASVIGLSANASAGVVTATLADINGPTNTTGFPIVIGSFGPFTYALPSGNTIVSATLSGTYGTPAYPWSTAGFDAIVDGTSVTVCAPFDPSCWFDGAPFRAFSIPLPSSLFAALYDGSATLTISQTNQFTVRYGSPTLTIGYVPEPGTVALVCVALLSLLGFGLMRRRSDA